MEFTAGARLEVRITPDDVGKRVSVRTETGAGEGAARFTDTLGILTSWTDGVLTLTRRSGETASLAESALVAGKVVPPAPARRRGVPAASVAELTRVSTRAWPAPETERVGDWLLRAAGGWTRRANSAVRLGPADPELDRVVAWYAARGLPPLVQVATGGGDGDERLVAALDARGWRPVGFAVLRVGALAPLADREPDGRVTVGRELTGRWLAGSPSAGRDPAVARRVLAAGPSVLLAEVAGGAGEPPLAVGRCVVDGRWAGFGAIDVAPAHRRRGLGTALMAELARAALAEGASAGWLQVTPENTAAGALYERLGFAEHHRYHYRAAPSD
ncbi:Acetyltransferase (GNAT) family protein [Streptomyces zhaozhouensis]|uniref:Acetyltransferase (GNAT) family protein n=1 Tax=Streptomyces zhaozhouensis TaxID=1300267 RepID=A0A286DR55_9ACTN|nr:GNAT family N-acetyltransferase [Streptomyces zhaozhouensis]SOD61034.1 Acetyltransferase (GNAT) family protein [Streptomyces zhaozhouensis]